MDHISLFSVTINQAIGVGFLGIPYAFQYSGILYSVILLNICCLVSFYIGTLAIELIFKENEGVRESLLEHKDNFYGHFLDPVYSILYLILFWVMVLSSFVAFSLVFANSFSAHLPLPYLKACNIEDDTSGNCIINFRIYLTVYALICYVLSIIGIKEQKLFQNILALLRFLIIAVLIIIALYRIFTGDFYLDTPFINIKHIDISYTIFIFALTYQIGLPSFTIISRENMIHLPRRIV